MVTTGSGNSKVKSTDYSTGKIDFNGELEDDKKRLLDFFDDLERNSLHSALKIGKLISDKGILGNGFSYVLPMITSEMSENEQLRVCKIGIKESNRFLGQNFVVPLLGKTNLGILEYDRKTEVFNLGFYYKPQSQLEEEVIRQSKLNSKYTSFSGKVELVQEDTSSRRKGLILLINDISEIQSVTANTQKYLTRQLK